MTNFIAIDVLDVWPLSASLHSRQHLLVESRPFVIFDPEKGDNPEIAKWKNLRNVLSRIARIDANKGFAFEQVSIKMLAAGDHVEWRRGAAEGNHALHLPIVTNPSALMYSGPQQMHIPAGVLTWVNNAVLCSEVNFGNTARIHLVLEVRKKEVVQ